MAIDFMTAPASITDTKPVLPVFKPRFWHCTDRLDARPVAWSLRNRPEEWEMASSYTILHKPSKHEFVVGFGYGFYRLYTADCSCSSTGGLFQHFQQGVFGRAFKWWRRHHGTTQYDPQHFAEHFVR